MIKAARKRRDLTQNQLAIMCKLTQGHISKLENFEHGDSLPNLGHVITIARELKLSPHALAGWFIDKDLKNQLEFSTELCITENEFIKKYNLFKNLELIKINSLK